MGAIAQGRVLRANQRLTHRTALEAKVADGIFANVLEPLEVLGCYVCSYNLGSRLRPSLPGRIPGERKMEGPWQPPKPVRPFAQNPTSHDGFPGGKMPLGHPQRRFRETLLNWLGGCQVWFSACTPQSAKPKVTDNMAGPPVLNETVVGPPVPNLLGICSMPVVRHPELPAVGQQHPDFGPRASCKHPDQSRYRRSKHGVAPYR
jgi:hypothetical protein